MRFVVGLIGVIMAVLGLLIASGSHEGGMFFAGMVFCLAGVGLNFWLIGTAELPRGTATPAE